MVSYAQNFEDVVLNRVFSNQATGFYIDVGAWDPDIDSVTKHFYLKGWRGINIEPTDFFHDKLVQARPDDINLKAAIGNGGPKSRFIEFAGSGISGLAESVEGMIAEGAGLGFEVKEFDVDVMALSEVTAKYARRAVDFLKIDVEGGERGVIESAEWRGFRPRVILVEAIAPITHEPTWFKWEGLLFDAGYSFALFDGLNRYYYRSEEPELKARLSVPANVLDGFVIAHVKILEDMVAQLQAAVASAAAQKEA
jgi:FkbM family methyltransferase